MEFGPASVRPGGSDRSSTSVTPNLSYNTSSLRTCFAADLLEDLRLFSVLFSLDSTCGEIQSCPLQKLHHDQLGLTTPQSYFKGMQSPLKRTMIGMIMSEHVYKCCLTKIKEKTSTPWNEQT